MCQWVYLNGGGQEIGRSERFEDRVEAEAWLGEAWPTLIEDGVEEVELVDVVSGRSIYRMGLSEDPRG